MSAADVRTALVALLTETFLGDRSVLVSLGPPQPGPQPDVIGVLGDKQEQDGEVERFVFDLVVSCLATGGSEAHATASARAHYLLGEISAALVADPTLDGECHTAALGLDHGESFAVAYDQSGRVPVGRLSEIQTTIVTWTGRSLLGSVKSAHSLP